MPRLKQRLDIVGRRSQASRVAAGQPSFVAMVFGDTPVATPKGMAFGEAYTPRVMPEPDDLEQLFIPEDKEAARRETYKWTVLGCVGIFFWATAFAASRILALVVGVFTATS